MQAVFREQFGKTAVKKIRARKLIPAIVYGRQTKPLPVEVDYRAFEHVIHTKAGANVIISLKVSGKQPLDKTVIIKEIQHDPVNDKIEHVDFNVISLTEKIKVNVQLVTKGESLGIKEGGVLDIIHHEIEVECLPTNIPEKIELSVKMMKIGDAVHAKDLVMPKDVTCKLDPEEVVVALHPPAKEELPTEEAAPGEPEVIEKGKKIEGAEGEAAPAAASPAAKKPEAAKKPADKKE